MNIIILTCPAEKKSVSILGFPTYIDFDDILNHPDSIVIRWGNGYTELNHSRVINKIGAIQKNVNKLQSSIDLGKVVKVPKIFSTEIPKGITAIRRPYNHSGGSKFKIVKGYCIIPPGYYATEAISTYKEYRVWFSPTSVLCARRVCMNDKQVKEYYKPYPCRSQWGYRFIGSCPKKLAYQTRKAMKAIGLQFGAADVLYKGGEYYFLELNSAPSIDCNKLIRFFKRTIEEEVRKYGYSRGRRNNQDAV